MKRSSYITLVLSGAISGTLLTGCSESSSPDVEQSADDGQMLTNNTYSAGRGYYHAPYHSWYPFPYNSYRNGLGYYHGGQYSATPHSSSITSSKSPGTARSPGVRRGGFGHSAIGHASGT